MKFKKPSSPAPFSASNEQSLMQQIFMANSVHSRVLPSSTNPKARVSEKQVPSANVGRASNPNASGGEDEKNKATDLRIKINRNSENCVNQSAVNNGSKLEPSEISYRQLHQDKMKSITIKSLKQGSLANQ